MIAYEPNEAVIIMPWQTLMAITVDILFNSCRIKRPLQFSMS
jgi:hypothetical protein